MKKQLQKIKIAAENLRSTKTERNDDLQHIEKQVERFKDVLQAIAKKTSVNAPSGQDQTAKDKRVRKTHEYMLAQAMEDSAKEFPMVPYSLLRTILEDCSRLEKTIATEIVNNEVNIENDVTKKLNSIIEQQLQVIQKQRRIVAKCHQDNETAKQKYQSAIRLSENATKINQLKDDQEECESRLEKERDIYASNMFDLLAEEDNISNYILNYVKYQQLYYKSALKEIETLMDGMNGLIRSGNKRVFNTSLQDHLDTTGRKISYVIELCVCCLLEKGLYEEGLLRVGCGKSKLMRMRSAMDANFVVPPLPIEYQDVHVIASVLKSYLRSLPEPLLTYRFYNEFLDIALISNDQHRKAAILNLLNMLPEGNYNNLKYLMKFLSYLSEKNQHNKMSTSNIAIVMSPNLLWPQNENDQNYAQQVSSTSAVNTVVETLISDWDFFFEGEVNFYETMSRDELFPDNGGFPYDKEQSLTAKHSDPMSISLYGVEKNGPGMHVRSSSHDTSLISLSENHQAPPLKSSQSNSSLSDQSPTTGSPKLPTRRKQKAPVPPMSTPQPPKAKLEAKVSAPMSVSKLLDTSNFSFIDSDTTDDLRGAGGGQMKRAGSTENILSKPDRPPRPVLANAECQTMSRAVVRQVPLKDKSSGGGAAPVRPVPVAAPRTALVKGDIGKSDENLEVTMREKPIVPDRPFTLMRPASFRAATSGGVTSPTTILTNEKVVEELSAAFKSTNTMNRKHSFREGRTAEPNGGDMPQSKQVTMYNIEKQQVAIVDVPPSGSPHPTRRQLFASDVENKENSQSIQASSDALSSSDEQSHGLPPSSPRDNKVKRPQVPPPARPRSSDGDSTNL